MTRLLDRVQRYRARHRSAVWPVPAGMDPECIAICQAMNRFPGIRTIESCWGHGERPFHVWFWADSLKDLPSLLYWFDDCHSGLPGWHVEAGTDCAMRPVVFMLEGPPNGSEDALAIASLLDAYADGGFGG